MRHFADLKVIAFDTFGTVVDWRGSIIRDLSRWAAARGLDLDWAALVDQWRGRYAGQKERVRSGVVPWTNLDDLHRQALLDILDGMGIAGLSEQDIDHINFAWHRLRALARRTARPGSAQGAVT